MSHHQQSFPHEPISFSQDNLLQIGPGRSISKCLKLKTHQSIDDLTFPSIDLKNDMKLNFDIEQSQIDSERSFRMAKSQNQLRIQSLIKQYQLRLAKQQECYALKEWKWKEEIKNLKEEHDTLAEQLKRVKNIHRQHQSECSICSDGKVIAHYHKLLAENEEHHQGCLSEKRELNCRIVDLQAKIEPLQQEYDKVCDQLRQVQKMLRNTQMKVRQVEAERDSAKNEVFEVGERWRQKMSWVEAERKQLKKELTYRENELNQSKTTIKSNQSTLNQKSLKSSSLQKSRDPRQDKENQFGGRSSVNKILIQQPHYEGLMEKNENTTKNNWAFRQAPMRWKYF